MKNILIPIICLAIVLQGCDNREVSPNVRRDPRGTYAENIRRALWSELDSSIIKPTDSDLNYASERLTDDEKFEIVTNEYLEVMNNPAFWDKTHPKDSATESEWQVFQNSSNAEKLLRAEQAARNYLGLMKH